LSCFDSESFSAASSACPISANPLALFVDLRDGQLCLAILSPSSKVRNSAAASSVLPRSDSNEACVSFTMRSLGNFFPRPRLPLGLVEILGYAPGIDHLHRRSRRGIRVDLRNLPERVHRFGVLSRVAVQPSQFLEQQMRLPFSIRCSFS